VLAALYRPGQKNNDMSYKPTVAPLSFGEKLGYGLGDTASNFFFQVFNIFLLYYYTDVFGLSPAAVGTMFLVTKVVDAVTDPVMGIIADRTESRWGKFRPYLLWAAIPYGLLGYAMFANPDLSDGGKLIYAYATYTLMMLAYTTINVPYGALMGVISPSSEERLKVASYRFICAFSAAWLIGTFVTPLKNVLGGGNEAEGFRLTMMVFSAVSIALFWVTFATTRERVKPPPVESSLKEDIRAVAANLPWLVMLVSGIFTLAQVAVKAGAQVYFLKYYVGDDGTPLFLIFDKTAVFISLSTFAFIGGVCMTRFLNRRFDKRSLLIALNLIGALLAIPFFFIPPDQYWLLVAFGCLTQFIAGPGPALVFAMYADCADYGEYRTGRRTTGLIYSAGGFAAKFGLAVGAGLSGFLLAGVGFVANAEQSETAMLGIRLMYTIYPAVLLVLGTISLFYYRLADSQVAKIELELASRRHSLAQPADGVS
jgi:GPH family glycoside/pentoside/hexuronide:cation symporter